MGQAPVLLAVGSLVVELGRQWVAVSGLGLLFLAWVLVDETRTRRLRRLISAFRRQDGGRR